MTSVGILLAGGTGTRLFPLSKSLNKHFLPIAGKPMIYYSLSTLIFSGVSEIYIVCTPKDEAAFLALFGRGEDLGIRINYAVQQNAGGLPSAIAAALDLSPEDRYSRYYVALGDNIFHGPGFGLGLAKSLDTLQTCGIFTKGVADPRRFAVVERDELGRVVDVEEKPTQPKSNEIVTGLYVFDSRLASAINSARPSSRGETEIVHLLKWYLQMEGSIQEIAMSRSAIWFDAGTVEAMSEASDFVLTMETKSQTLVGSPEEAAFRMGKIDGRQLASSIGRMPLCEYREQLRRVLN